MSQELNLTTDQVVEFKQAGSASYHGGGVGGSYLHAAHVTPPNVKNASEALCLCAMLTGGSISSISSTG